jgi:transposase
MIINLYKAKLAKTPEGTIRMFRQLISKELGIGERTISKTISEYNSTKTITSPCKKRTRLSFKDSFDDFDRNAVRRHVHSFWFQKQVPTVDKIYNVVCSDKTLPHISRTNLFKLLKLMDFEYTKRLRNSALTEKDEIVYWRRTFLEDLKRYRDEGRHIYYLGETWINAGECSNKTWDDKTIKSHRDTFLKGLTKDSKNPSGKGKRLIVLHIGSEDGFVPGGLLCFESKKNSADYHDEINGDTFYEWLESILPRLKKNCVIIMDNASNHSVKIEKVPTSNTRKPDIISWLESKGQVIDRPMVIPHLLVLVNRIKHIHPDKYAVDELVKEHGRTVLRLPPYHCELNPIELAWSSVKNYVKMNYTTYKLSDVKVLLNEGINHVTPAMWKNLIDHTKKIEEKFWEIDFVIDEILSAETEPVDMNITEDTSLNSDSC